MITGVDVVKETIRVAAGEKLSVKQKDVSIRGHSIECRINAEDPDRNFAPFPGPIHRFEPPGGPGVRVDTHCRAGYVIPPNYDSMIGKLIVHAPDRTTAIARMRGALDEFVIEPTRTTIPLHRRILDTQEFINASLDIHSVERMLRDGSATAPSSTKTTST
jgi:acetyl-CoA carboxylase biotin carboxylase subunit